MSEAHGRGVAEEGEKRSGIAGTWRAQQKACGGQHGWLVTVARKSVQTFGSGTLKPYTGSLPSKTGLAGFQPSPANWKETSDVWQHATQPFGWWG